MEETKPLNHSRIWSPEDKKLAAKLYKNGATVTEIAERVERTELAVASQLSSQGFSLKGHYPRRTVRHSDKETTVVRSKVVPQKKSFWRRLFG
jgi:transposase-like protein